MKVLFFDKAKASYWVLIVVGVVFSRVLFVPFLYQICAVVGQ